jgi:hypothetical protein
MDKKLVLKKGKDRTNKVLGLKGISPKKLSNGSEGEFGQEAAQVDRALERSFGGVMLEHQKRVKAAGALAKVAAHWTDGDAKRLVLSLVNRYDKPHLVRGSLKPPLKKLVFSPRNSRCHSAKIKDLDWSKGWWTDDSFGMHYLHVPHKDGETIHRVYCRGCDQPRLQVENGKLYWLISR